MSHDTIINASNNDALENATHINLDEMRQAGYIDIPAVPQTWKYVRTLVVYWAALGLSRTRWTDMAKTEVWRSLAAIRTVVMACSEGLLRMKDGWDSIMSNPDFESLRILLAKQHMVPAHGELWSKVLGPFLYRLSRQLLRHIEYMLEYEATPPSWLTRFKDAGDKEAGWDLNHLPTPVSPVVPVITDPSEAYRPEPICPQLRIPSEESPVDRPVKAVPAYG